MFTHDEFSGAFAFVIPGYRCSCTLFEFFELKASFDAKFRSSKNVVQEGKAASLKETKHKIRAF